MAPTKRDSSLANHNYSRRSYNRDGYKSFDEFYPFYLGEHCNQVNRRLHLIASTNAIILLVFAILTGTFYLIPLGIVQGYAFAWIGHFFFEKNKPATFQHPIYSFMGDFKMLFEVWTGRRTF